MSCWATCEAKVDDLHRDRVAAAGELERRPESDLRGDLPGRSTGFEQVASVMAGAIVGFDSDNARSSKNSSLHQAARPVSVTGLLNALPKTPLYKRLKDASRLVADRLATSSSSPTSCPRRCRRPQTEQGATNGCSSGCAPPQQSQARHMLIHTRRPARNKLVGSRGPRDLTASFGHHSAGVAKSAWPTSSLLLGGAAPAERCATP
jgi:hypothetical protein